jgi:hypothetical protein
MGMWLNSSINATLRWEHDGLKIGVLFLMLAGLLSIGLKKKSEVRLTERKILTRALERQFNPLDKSGIDAVAAQQED